MTKLQAYYEGRNSVEDNGTVWPMESEMNTTELKTAWKQGVRDMLAELRINADTEWDSEEGL